MYMSMSVFQIAAEKVLKEKNFSHALKLFELSGVSIFIIFHVHTCIVDGMYTCI